MSFVIHCDTSEIQELVLPLLAELDEVILCFYEIFHHAYNKFGVESLTKVLFVYVLIDRLNRLLLVLSPINLLVYHLQLHFHVL